MRDSCGEVRTSIRSGRGSGPNDAAATYATGARCESPVDRWEMRMSDRVKFSFQLRFGKTQRPPTGTPKQRRLEGRRIQDGRRAVSINANLKIHELSEGRWLAYVRLRKEGAAQFFPIGPVGDCPEDVLRSLGRLKEGVKV